MPHSATRKSEPRGGRKGKVTICHATGSATNPYVEITISENALKAHRAHQHGEDLIGVPQGGCPGGVAATAAGVTDTQPAAASTPARSRGGVAVTGTDSSSGTAGAGAGGVAGVNADSGTRPATAVAAVPRGESGRGGSLPFTGFGLTVLALVAAACLVAGLRLRSATNRNA